MQGSPTSQSTDFFSHRSCGQRGGRDEAEHDGGGLSPCLYSNNSIEITKPSSTNDKEAHIQSLCGILTPYHKKQAQTLYLNVERLVKREAKSTNHVGFLTLTYQENITDHKEAYKRFRSFNTNFLSKHSEFGKWVCVKERQKRGSWHYHLVITLQEDIRAGFDFDEYDKWLKGSRLQNTFPTGNNYIRRLWDDLRSSLEKYGLGKIFSLEPVRANEQAMARYVGKYISKHMSQKTDEDKGVRLVNYSKNWSKNSVKFAWHTDNAKEWRQKLKYFAMLHGCQEFYQLSEKFGPGWAFRYVEDIYNVYENVVQIAKNNNKEYTPQIIKNIPRNREIREKSQIKNLTFRSGKTKKQRDEETKKIIFKSEIPALVEKYIEDHEVEISIDESIKETFLLKQLPSTEQIPSSVPF